MHFRLLGLLGAAGAVFLSFNCGGTVVFEATGGSSGSTTDASSTGTALTATGSTQSTGTTSVNTSTSVSTTSGTTTSCEQVCAKFDAFGCADEGCIASCADVLSGPCAMVFSAFVDCISEFATDCEDLPQQCDAQSDAYLLCYAGGCSGEQLCSGTGSGGGETFCSCTESCEVGTWEATCSSSGGQGQCDCKVDGMLVGKCDEANPSCDVEVGCCSQFFHPY
jgi:hypothetical protein